MASFTRTIFTVVNFSHEEKSDFTFSDSSKIEVDGDAGVLTLKSIGTPSGFSPSKAFSFSKDANISATGPLINPGGLTAFVGFFATFKEPKGGAEGVESVSTVRFRLNDGTSDRYWNGASWAVAGAGNWNTLAEVQANLSAFPITAKKLRPVFNLKTTDSDVTPTVSRLVVGYQVDVPSFSEEYIYRTFIKRLKEVRGLAEMVIPFPATGSTLSKAQINALEVDEPLPNITNIEGVYNYDTDSALSTNLVSSVSSEVVATLSSSLSENVNAYLRVQYQPTVSVLTHPDFNEVSTLPAILIENVSEMFVSGSMTFDGTVNVSDNSTVATRSPRQVQYTMTLVMVASRNLELLRLVEAVESSLRRDPMIVSQTLGEKISVMITGPLTLSPTVSDLSHAHEARLEVTLRGCNKWIFEPETVFGIDKLALSGDLSENVT